MSRFLSWISSTFGAASLILVVLSCAAGGRSARAMGPTVSRHCAVGSAACEDCVDQNNDCGGYDGVESCAHTGEGDPRICDGDGDGCHCGYVYQTCQCG
jgi:hypothetical protein